MKKVLIGAAIFFAGIFFGLILAGGPLRAQDAPNTPDVPNAPDIMPKLNEIAKSQEQILAGINSLKEDIQIVKIRVTQMQ